MFVHRRDGSLVVARIYPFVDMIESAERMAQEPYIDVQVDGTIFAEGRNWTVAAYTAHVAQLLNALSVAQTICDEQTGK